MKAIIGAISIVLVSSLAYAVCLSGHPSITEEHAKSQSVLIGKVIEKKDMPESGRYYDGTNYTVEIQEVIKGNLTNSVIIFIENSSGRFPMSVGETYILFVYHQLGRYQIDNCGNSGLLSEKQVTLETLRHLSKPAVGYVPDQETAIRIAVAVWSSIYGNEQIEKEKPYKAILKNGIWYVTGSLPEGWVGGVAEAEINKESGCIIQIRHGQ